MLIVSPFESANNSFSFRERSRSDIPYFMDLGFPFLLFFALGLLSGLLGGLLGIGGGVVTVPFLYYYYLYSGSYPNKIMQVAACTSLAAALITSALATYFQFKKRAIQFSLIKWMAPSLLIGCVLGASVAHHIQSRILSLIFAFMAALMGIYFFFPKLPKLHIASQPNISLSLFALFIGVLSSMLGIGGGSLAFPLLIGYQVPIKNALATSSTATFITAGVGTLAYLLLAWNFPGYIDLSAWTAMSIGSVITSKSGVKLAHQLEVTLIKKIFGICLILISLGMLLM